MTKEKTSRQLKRGQRSKPVRAKKAKPEVRVLLEAAVRVYEAKLQGRRVKPEVYFGGGCHVES
jgi:hypothetical protein